MTHASPPGPRAVRCAIIISSDRPGPRSRLNLLGALPIVLAAGCSGTLRSGTRAAPAVAARIHHVVLLKLVDPSDAPALHQACDAALAEIPVVLGYWAGPPLDTGRENVDGNYDLALHIGFASTADYDAYVAHPRHQALLAAWSDRLRWIHIHDVAGEQLTAEN